LFVIYFIKKVLLSGLGADEQLAGYSRHRTTFRLGGWKALENELEMEINRISRRNLGRDDRYKKIPCKSSLIFLFFIYLV